MYAATHSPCTHDVEVVVGTELLLERFHLQQTADNTRVVAGQMVKEGGVKSVVSGQYRKLLEKKPWLCSPKEESTATSDDTDQDSRQSLTQVRGLCYHGRSGSRGGVSRGRF
jgi:hypothetical protein